MEYEDLEGKYFTYLEPQYDSAKSFYKKAKVYNVGRCLYLVSYKTVVAQYDTLTGNYIINGEYSRTTTRHIREFTRQIGLDYKDLTKYM